MLRSTRCPGVTVPLTMISGLIASPALGLVMTGGATDWAGVGDGVRPAEVGVGAGVAWAGVGDGVAITGGLGGETVGVGRTTGGGLGAGRSTMKTQDVVASLPA